MPGTTWHEFAGWSIGAEATMWVQIAIMVIAAGLFGWRIVGLLMANREHHVDRR